jgi:hypothetical protein
MSTQNANAVAITGGTLNNVVIGGSTPNAGTFTTATATLFDGSGANLTSLNGSNVSSGTVANARTTAASANGASTIVTRDATGNFAANTITANLTGTASSATSATSATTATNIAGGAAGGIPYQTGAGATSILAAGTGVLVGGTTPAYSTAPILTGTNFTSIPNGATTATSANTASAIVLRDAGGNFTAGTITATLNGSATSATSAGSATTANTVTQAAQANITSVGTLTSLTSSGNITATNGAGLSRIQADGDIYAYRTGGTTGVIFLNSAGNKYLYNDGSQYVMPAQNLQVNGVTLTGNTLTAGTGISVSASTGASTITNTGVTSVNGATGAVTITSGAAAASAIAQNNTLYTIGTPSNTQLTGMSVTITPSSTSSKILLFFGMGYSYSGPATYVFNFFRN